MGQALTAIAGGIIGFFVGGGPTGALYGFEIGLLAGTVISPTKLPGTSGPRLTDGNTTTATVGGPVNFGWGFFAVSGTVIYLGQVKEHSQTTNSGAKGGPTQSQTTYSYTQTIAIGLCEGVLGSLRRVWENGQLVYDARPQQSGESDAAFTARINANVKYAATFVLYLGGEAQLADPTMEADLGVGNSPAYRGLAYIMYPDRALRDDQGQHHPTFKFECHIELVGYESDDVPPTVEQLINLICARCGYDTGSQIDATTLSSTSVYGYAIKSVMAGRDALTPLRSVGLWDCVESGPKLKFVKRGGAPVRTLDQTAIGIYDASASSQTPGPAVTVTETQEVELPRSIRMSYASADQDYEPGAQSSPSRYDTDAVNDTDISIGGVVMSDGDAAKLVEVLWNDAWQGRDAYATSVDQSNADLEPSDVIFVPVLGDQVRMRIDQVDDSSQVLRKLSLILDDDGTYVSTAVATGPTRPVQVMGVTSGTALVLMDLPAVSESDDDPGFYAVGYGDGTGNLWTGAVVYKSVDGDTFTQKATVSGSPPMGKLKANLAGSQALTWDDSVYVDVAMIKGDFPSRTDDDVLAGANTVAVGADGRWEVLQFGVSTPMTDIGGPFLRLSHLLRGRRGTESFVGTGLADDYVIGLTFGALFRIAMQTSEVGALRTYKAVSVGEPYASGTDQTFTGEGLALKPFSPVYLGGHLSGSDVVFTWIRRDRFGSELVSGSDTLMSEASEQYDVDVLDNADLTHVFRTIHVTTNSATYTSSMIASDYGSAQSHYNFRVYQISAATGRGYPTQADVTPL